MPIYEVEYQGRSFEVEAPSLRAAITAVKRMPPPIVERQATPPPETATAGMMGQSTIEDGDPKRTTPFSQTEWDAMPAGERMTNILQWAGKAVSGMTGMNEAGREAIENPKTTLALAAAPLVAGKVASVIPTRAKAGAKFQEVQQAVGDVPIDASDVKQSVLGMRQLSRRGTSMPTGAAQLEKRIAPTVTGGPRGMRWSMVAEGPPMKYTEARDFYSNLRRLSAVEAKRMNPNMRRKLNELLASLDQTLEKTAATGGKDAVYRRAMKEYAVASRTREFAEMVAKYGAGIAGLGAAYNMLKD